MSALSECYATCDGYFVSVDAMCAEEEATACSKIALVNKWNLSSLLVRAALDRASVMSGGRSSPESPHVYRGGFKLPKHLKSPLHLPGEGEDGIGHASPLLHKCPTMTGLDSYSEGSSILLRAIP